MLLLCALRCCCSVWPGACGFAGCAVWHRVWLIPCCSRCACALPPPWLRCCWLRLLLGLHVWQRAWLVLRPLWHAARAPWSDGVLACILAASSIMIRSLRPHGGPTRSLTHLPGRWWLWLMLWPHNACGLLLAAHGRWPWPRPVGFATGMLTLMRCVGLRRLALRLHQLGLSIRAPLDCLMHRSSHRSARMVSDLGCLLHMRV